MSRDGAAVDVAALAERVAALEAALVDAIGPRPDVAIRAMEDHVLATLAADVARLRERIEELALAVGDDVSGLDAAFRLLVDALVNEIVMDGGGVLGPLAEKSILAALDDDPAPDLAPTPMPTPPDLSGALAQLQRIGMSAATSPPLADRSRHGTPEPDPYEVRARYLGRCPVCGDPTIVGWIHTCQPATPPPPALPDPAPTGGRFGLAPEMDPTLHDLVSQLWEAVYGSPPPAMPESPSAVWAKLLARLRAAFAVRADPALDAGVMVHQISPGDNRFRVTVTGGSSPYAPPAPALDAETRALMLRAADVLWQTSAYYRPDLGDHPRDIAARLRQLAGEP